jgi:ketosteroid isomerase-like protein
MRYQRVVSGLGLAAFALLSACAQGTERSPGADPRSEADIAAIRGLFERYDSTVSGGLAEEWMSLLSDDIVWMVPDQDALVGKDAVWGRVESLFSDLTMEHVTGVDEVRVAGDWAYVRGTYAFRVTPKAGGETIEEVGKSVLILEREAGSSWHIARNIWNANYPTE